MDIGIGLPSTIPSVDGQTVLEWARRAEQRNFSTLAVIDRLVYGSYEPLIALAAAAATTARIRLMTTILISPVRSNTALLAKELASIDRLSDGRLVLGLGLGGRSDDYEASGLSTKGRGSKLEAQLDELRRIWAGERRGFAGPIGPPPVRAGGPLVLMGGMSDAAMTRAARMADGWISGSSGAEGFSANAQKFRSAWQAAGRQGSPRIASQANFALGPNAREYADRFLKDYYAAAGAYAERIARLAFVSVEQVRERVAGYREAGCDELIIFPSNPDPAQVDLLADAIGEG